MATSKRWRMTRFQFLDFRLPQLLLMLPNRNNGVMELPFDSLHAMDVRILRTFLPTLRHLTGRKFDEQRKKGKALNLRRPDKDLSLNCKDYFFILMMLYNCCCCLLCDKKDRCFTSRFSYTPSYSVDALGSDSLVDSCFLSLTSSCVLDLIISFAEITAPMCCRVPIIWISLCYIFHHPAH